MNPLLTLYRTCSWVVSQPPVTRQLTMVHQDMSSGAAALAYSLYIGHRKGYGSNLTSDYRPSSVNNITLGTTMLFVGWLGFNSGSACSANLRGPLAFARFVPMLMCLTAVQAMFVTIVAACSGGLTWMLMDCRRNCLLVGSLKSSRRPPPAEVVDDCILQRNCDWLGRCDTVCRLCRNSFVLLGEDTSACQPPN